jgi:hypothetical protein
MPKERKPLLMRKSMETKKGLKKMRKALSSIVKPKRKSLNSKRRISKCVCSLIRNDCIFISHSL